MRDDTTGKICNAPKCKRPSAIGLRGLKLCDAHWFELAEIEDPLANESRLMQWGFPTRQKTPG